MPGEFTLVDLFSGAGGFTEGFSQALQARGVKFKASAVNHCEQALATHARNHPYAEHFCDSVFDVNPLLTAPGGYIDVLCISPECIYHSNAKGGGPCDDQSRSGANDLFRWLDSLIVHNVVLENVAEFMKWGPLYKRRTFYNGRWHEKDRPIPHKRGLFFKQFCAELARRGYILEYKVLNSADYGAPTARKRIFLQATLDGGLRWPNQTHNRQGVDLPQWRPAREVLNLDDIGPSLREWQAGQVGPKYTPLVPKTLARIRGGIERFWGEGPTSFFVELFGTSIGRSIDRPMPSLTTGCNNHYLVTPVPLLCKYYSTGLNAVTVDQCMPTVTTKDSFYLLSGMNHEYGFDLHYRQVRINEVKRAMGFDRYVFPVSATSAKKQIGNAVQVHQSRALADVQVSNYIRRKS